MDCPSHHVLAQTLPACSCLQVMNAQDALSDRFYNALYASLLHQDFPRSTSVPQFLSLLIQAMKADVSGRRVAAFLKRLLQVCLQAMGPYKGNQHIC
jgi:ribosome biogenesis protein MAK21